MTDIILPTLLTAPKHSEQTEQIAALQCTLEQAYLIEASAGTGKTWTLTGIILRLLIEKKYPPERIIATTFTRAAAAEMQERISERLHSFYGLVRWLQGMASTQPEWFDGAAPMDQIITYATEAGHDAADPINEHLLEFILSQPATFLNEVIYRTGLLLTSLDKLFVGTLDSLAQKWLNEFAAQIGHQSGMEILNHAEQKVAAIVHDELRAEEVRLKHAHPEFYQIFKAFYPNFFSQVAAVASIVNKAIDFYSAPIDELNMPADTDISSAQTVIDQILNTDFTGFTPYFDADFRKSVSMNQSLGFGKQIHHLPHVLSLIQKHGALFVNFVDDDALKLIDSITKAAEKEWQIFNKSANPSDVHQFMALPIQALSDIANLYTALGEQAKLYHGHICRHIIVSAKNQIAQRLETQNQTTFTLQMVRLNEALGNSPALARHIRHHYPVALIDESQDVNGLQVELIERVYLTEIAHYHKSLIRYEQIGGDKPKLPRGFLLLVGDPKQAIYRFRGGDVANYNLIKHYGNQDALIKAPLIDQSLSLTVNRRSSKALIEALNAWFENNGQEGVANHANLGQGIFYQQIQAHKDSGGIQWQANAYADYYGNHPVAVLHFDHIEGNQKADKRAEKIAQHINTILQGDHTLHGQKILPKHIAVLGRTADALDKIKSKLDHLKIPAVIPKEINVFMTQAADDLLALIIAMVQPNHSENLGKFLVSRLVGMTLKQAMTIIEPNEQDLSDAPSDAQSLKTHILTYLKKSYERWQRYGVSSALAYALYHSPIDSDHDKSPWLKAATQGERYLADLERLVALVSEQSQLHEMCLIAWYHKQMSADVDSYNKRPILPSESGVNLMTIHKSKGLEFPIVYVIGMDEKPRNNNGLTIYPYSDHNFQRRLSISKGNHIDESYYHDINRQELIDELRRLGYVALTRASEQLYIVGGDLSKKDSKEMPLYQWLDCAGEKSLSLPDRLKDRVGWIAMTEADLLSQPYQNQLSNPIAKNYAPWDAIMTKTQFFGEHKTSFSALITRLDKSVIPPDEADIDQLSVITDTAASDQLDNIRASFFKGSVAGDFLHKVMQFLPTDRLKSASSQAAHDIISGVIYEQGRKLGIAERYLPTWQTGARIHASGGQTNDHDKLVAWIDQLAYAPFRASRRSLMSLPMTAQLRELSFTLGLGDGFSIARLNEVFKAHSDKDLVLLEDDYRTIYYRYLRGEIDLVYESDGRFFIVDYKSNYLGGTPDDYHDHAMSAAMDKVGYWLQAAIYQVALHRLLKIRLKDYVGNEAYYLGGVEYVFLRGVQDDDENTGRLFWQPPLSLILALDDIL
ncbi:UvrD-helicase domain-containing protein [Moraxella catarrhalis]|uniref:RecBCD enzyme subunit RecB n=1 Tax=Moraxella catarrhalis TaxID=480 RepID=A0A198UE05_MORCA|nr:UvrD-helicase domain-containing protein [Moraxella catarrhalis]OAU94369.1 Exodeoxyribonuclease V beta chain [Moraxella catarrhalis]OAU94663.1 Exodeoxyribonuclease V beta chain [Moraxella catarrhalis]OAU97037.1 Exodeoxyribonuclease V beta chain [Moraxella catarrhalis]